MSVRTSPAKVTAPRLSQVLDRPPLFRRLDQARSGGIVWIAAPPGAGKTSLVASYIRNREARAVWYQLDAGDADPATLFHYLGLAVHAANPRLRRRLPALTKEYLPGVAVFSRRFFEALSLLSGLPPVWVLDNFHDLPPGSTGQDLLLEGMEILAASVSVIVCSRDLPPPSLARLRMRWRVSVLDAKDLSLSRAEAQRLARLRGIRLSRAAVDRAHAETQGWAAGLTLLMEDDSRRAVSGASRTAGGWQTLFDYLASEIFAQMDPAVRQILLATAVLPRITAAAAQALSGNEQAPAVLADLARRNYFTVAHRSGEVYQYHRLFRTFLLAQAAREPQHQGVAGLRRGAEVLEEAGEIESAAMLLINGKDAEALAGLCERCASQLMAQGRAQTLVSWITAVPPAQRARRPWLIYWLGAAQQPFDPARSHFALAFELFRNRDDVHGQYLAWAGIAHCYLLLWDEFVSADRWLDAFDGLWRRHPQFPSDEIERQVVSGLVALLVFRRPQDASIASWAARLATIVYNAGLPEEQIRISSPLLTYYLWTGDLGNAGLLIDTLSRASRLRGVADTERIVFLLLEAAYLWHVGEFRRCLAVVSDALELGTSAGIHIFDGRVRAQALYAYLGLQDLSQAGPIVAEVGSRVSVHRQLDASHYHYQATCFHRLQGDLQRAGVHIGTALAFANRSGAVFPRGLCHLSDGLLRIARADYAGAAQHIRAAQRIAESMRSSLLSYMALIARAWHAEARGDQSEACRRVAEAFAFGARHQYINPWECWQREMMVQLCQVALECGIEPGYTQTLIRRQGLLPRDSVNASDAWPWAVKIYSFGRLRIEVDGRPLPASRKGWSKPLEMLRVIIAHGGRAVPSRILAENLWPEADGDAALQSLSTTMHRLRRLLGREKTLVVEDGRISLDSGRVWLDRWRFEVLSDPGGFAAQGGGDGQADRDALLRCYRGDFLVDEDAAWVFAPREQLRSKFRRRHRRHSELLQQHGDWAAAVDWCRRGIEIDPLAEEMHAGLIRSYCRLGQMIEAYAAYERCQNLFMALFNRAPGTEIQSAYREAGVRLAEFRDGARPDET